MMSSTQIALDKDTGLPFDSSSIFAECPMVEVVDGRIIQSVKGS
jgi:hypothetical protein